jgi:pyrimidine-nucleoside phosphorylase
VVELGGGGKKKDDPIDHSVGVIVHYKVGDLIQKDTPLFTIHANDRATMEAAQQRMLAAHTISDTSVQRLPRFYQRITA